LSASQPNCMSMMRFPTAVVGGPFYGPLETSRLPLSLTRSGLSWNRF